MHIDSDDNGREKVILSFAAEVSPSHKEAILALADNPDLIVFRLVNFTEQQLAEKQREVSLAWDSLKEEGITIHHTGVNVFINKVEVGVEPAPAPEGAVEDSISQNNLALDTNEDSEKSGLFQRIASFFKSIFSWLVK